MILYVKNMLSERCKLYLDTQLSEVGLQFKEIEPQVIEILNNWTPDQREDLEARLRAVGMEIMIHRKVSLVEKTENLIKEMVNDLSEIPKGNYSDYISYHLKTDYTLLSKIFSEAKGITIQQYIILAKIEKISEMLADENMSLTDISFKLQYSSVAHLSNQFKKITGYSPSDFRRLEKRDFKIENPFLVRSDEVQQL